MSQRRDYRTTAATTRKSDCHFLLGLRHGFQRHLAITLIICHGLDHDRYDLQVEVSKNKIPYLVTHDGRTIRRKQTLDFARTPPFELCHVWLGTMGVLMLSTRWPPTDAAVGFCRVFFYISALTWLRLQRLEWLAFCLCAGDEPCRY